MTSNLEGAPVVGNRTITKPNPKEVSEGFDDEDLGSAGLSLIPEYGIALACGKDGIAYEVNYQQHGQDQTRRLRARRDQLRQARAAACLVHLHAEPNIDNAPQDSSTLDFIYDNKTRHMHSTSVQYMSPVHGMMLFCWGENSQLRAWSMSPKGVLTLLASSAEVASATPPIPAAACLAAS